MFYLKKLIFITSVLIIFSGCSSKYIDIETLHPSKENIHMKDIFVEEFNNDFIFQTKQIKQVLEENIVDKKQIFNLEKTHENIDSIITGDVKTRLDIDPYYKYTNDYVICERYIYDEKTKSRYCVEYRKRKIYCEKRDYSLRTNILITDKRNILKFEKEYEKHYNDKECFENIPYHFYRFNTPISLNRDEDNIYMDLAKKVANEFLSDVSVHYIKYKVNLIEKLDDSLLYENNDRLLYEKLIKNIKDDIYPNTTLNSLEDLNNKYGSHSYEILYSIGVIKEKKNQYEEAIKYYNKALDVCKNKENKELIQNGLNQAKENMQLKEEALIQLK
jgi:tetratricopeptide (TPR) repeat protein